MFFKKYVSIVVSIVPICVLIMLNIKRFCKIKNLFKMLKPNNDLNLKPTDMSTSMICSTMIFKKSNKKNVEKYYYRNIQ